MNPNQSPFAMAGSAPTPRGIENLKQKLQMEIDRVKTINDNMMQAITFIYGPFPPQPSPGGVEKDRPRYENVDALLNELDNQITQTYTLSTVLNVGH